MADSITLTLYIVVGIISLIIVISAFKGARTFFKLRRPYIKTPKFRGRGILRDDERFGSAVIVAYQPTSSFAGFLHLVSQNGILFKEWYREDEIKPSHSLENAGGAERPVWIRSGVRYVDKPYNKETIDSEKRLKELADKLDFQKIEEKVAINEAATLKDTVLDMVKEMKEQPKVEIGKVLK